MVRRIIESADAKYFRYSVETHPYKNGFTQVNVVDNYFDHSDYAFVNLDTGEIKSYSDVALNYVMRILKNAGMSMYDVSPQGSYKFYTRPHSSEVIDIELTEMN